MPLPAVAGTASLPWDFCCSRGLFPGQFLQFETALPEEAVAVVPSFQLVPLLQIFPVSSILVASAWNPLCGAETHDHELLFERGFHMKIIEDPSPPFV